MTVRQFIAEMLQYPNLDAEINFKANVANTDNAELDIPVEIEFTERDIEDATSYDIILYSDHANKTPTCEEQNAIHQLLQHNDSISIMIDKDTTTSGYILIKNSKNDVLREIDVDGIHSVEDNLMIILQSIL
jgi:methyltransferase-like protein